MVKKVSIELQVVINRGSSYVESFCGLVWCIPVVLDSVDDTLPKVC